MRAGTNGRDSISLIHWKSMHDQGGDRDAGDTHVRTPGSSSSRRPSGSVGNRGGDWNASRTNLWLAVGLQREFLMENSPFPSRPSSPLPSTQPSLSGANTQVERVQTPMTPSKLVKRKSLGFVRLGFDGGMTEKKSANVGKYPTLGFGLLPRRVRGGLWLD